MRGPLASASGIPVRLSGRAAHGAECQMGGLTRILHSGKPDELMAEIPTVVVEPLPDKDNLDAVSLNDILGDPLISECWEFNYLHDIGFLMAAFDPEVRHLVSVHVVHGFWKQEDPNRLMLVV